MNAMETKSGAPGENLVLAIGESFRSRLVPARRGFQTEVRINRRRCFVDMLDCVILADDVFELKLCAENPARTVYFASTESLRTSGDWLGACYKDAGISMVSAIRKAHQDVVTAERACQPNSLALAGALILVAQEQHLHKPYRLSLAWRVFDIYHKILGPNDVRWLAVQSVIAYCQEKGTAGVLLEEKFRRLVALQDQHGAPDSERAAALGNLACVCRQSQRFEEAADLFARAAKLACGEGGMFLTSKEAECRAQLGGYKMAYELISDFPDEYFSLRESEWSECARDCLREPAIFND